MDSLSKTLLPLWEVAALLLNTTRFVCLATNTVSEKIKIFSLPRTCREIRPSRSNSREPESEGRRTKPRHPFEHQQPPFFVDLSVPTIHPIILLPSYPRYDLSDITCDIQIGEIQPVPPVVPDGGTDRVQREDRQLPRKPRDRSELQGRLCPAPGPMSVADERPHVT